jgi:heat shock protein HspQ
MKMLKYELYQSTTEEGVDITITKEMPWSEVNEENAKQEAYKGEYEIFDDGEPEPVQEPTTDDILNALLGVE